MALNETQIRDLYARRARRYDLTANLYYLLGFREHAYRRRAVERLHLQEGDTVLEIGCGTGSLSARLRLTHPGARLVALDIDREALLRARGNLAAAASPGTLARVRTGSRFRACMDRRPCWRHARNRGASRRRASPDPGRRNPAPPAGFSFVGARCTGGHSLDRSRILSHA